jgi:hypothetical protein
LIVIWIVFVIIGIINSWNQAQIFILIFWLTLDFLFETIDLIYNIKYCDWWYKF